MSDPEQQIAEALKKLVNAQTNENGTRLAAFESLMNEVSVALGDLVTAMESRGDDGEKLARAMAAALKGMPRPDAPTVNVAAPTVNVTVEPTPFHNHIASPEVTVNVPEAVVNVERPVPPKGWEVAFKFDGPNLSVPSGMTLTRIN